MVPNTKSRYTLERRSPQQLIIKKSKLRNREVVLPFALFYAGALASFLWILWAGYRTATSGAPLGWDGYIAALCWFWLVIALVFMHRDLPGYTLEFDGIAKTLKKNGRPVVSSGDVRRVNIEHHLYNTQSPDSLGHFVVTVLVGNVGHESRIDCKDYLIPTESAHAQMMKEANEMAQLLDTTVTTSEVEYRPEVDWD